MNLAKKLSVAATIALALAASEVAAQTATQESRLEFKPNASAPPAASLLVERDRAAQAFTNGQASRRRLEKSPRSSGHDRVARRSNRRVARSAGHATAHYPSEPNWRPAIASRPRLRREPRSMRLSR